MSYRRRTGLLPSNKTYTWHGVYTMLTVYTGDTGRKSFPSAGIASSKEIERKWDSNLTSKAHYYYRVMFYYNIYTDKEK